MARLVDVKDHKLFLDVAKAISGTPEGAKCRFVIIGDGELKDDLVRYAEEICVKDRVIFTGWYMDMPELYRALDMVLLTSKNEGTPVSLIQALASSRPVVSTDVGGVRNVIMEGQSGYVVGKNNTREFSERVLELLRDRQKRERFGLAGREYVRERFSTSRLVRDLEKLYTDLVTRRK